MGASQHCVQRRGIAVLLLFLAEMRVAGKRALRWRFLCHSAKCLGATRLPRSFSSYLTNRLQSWQRTVDALRATVPAASVPPRAITVGIGEKTLEGKSGVTTPQSILSEDAEVRKALGNSTVVAALVNGRAWDLKRPLETDATLEFVDFNHPAVCVPDDFKFVFRLPFFLCVIVGIIRKCILRDFLFCAFTLLFLHRAGKCSGIHRLMY